MDTILLIVLLVAMLGLVGLQVVILFRKPKMDVGSINQALHSVESYYERLERSVREEISKNREEANSTSRQSREELAVALKGFNESLLSNMGEIAKLQKAQLDVFSERLDKLTQANDQRLTSMREMVEQRLLLIQEDNGKKLEVVRQESLSAAQNTRHVVSVSLKEFSETIVKSLNDIGTNQTNQLSSVVHQLTKLTETTERTLDDQKTVIDERLKQMQTDNRGSAKELREEVNSSLKGFNDSVLKGLYNMADSQQKQMELFSANLTNLTESIQKRLDDLRTSVEIKLKSIQEDNTKQLDQIRVTVDEKLHGTLEKRLGESFKQVSERLEQVYKGFGEMQALATSVGDLKRVLTNVKTRGTWGEVQLGSMLEQVLISDQYEENVATKMGGERVEFAIKLPGRTDDTNEIVWLPIDAKCPVEDYQRLLDAQEKSDADAAEAASKQLENTIRVCAKNICEKYLNPPKTTDFGILFLPIEGLFAEVIRRSGLTESLQRESRVVIAGPTTLWSILNSLQMGFRSLAIQKRSSEVWNLLAAVKTEWTKYSEILDKVQKKLHEASDSIEKTQTRVRAIGRKLKEVQGIPSTESHAILMLDGEDHVEHDGLGEEAETDQRQS